MSDLISREEVLRAIITSGEVEPDLGYTHLHKVIENLPSAEPKWVPVTERNPEEYDAYFITYESESWGGPKLPLITKIGTYNPYNRACPWLEDTGGVIAWMSLPEPYHPKEGRE